MSSKLDRNLQRKLLSSVAEKYPDYLSAIELLTNDADDETLLKEITNIYYLEENELIAVRWVSGPNGRYPSFTKATSKGLDFLADDGGLSAILNVVTIKLHSDTIQELMIAKVEASNEAPTIKKNLIKKIKELPADALGKASISLMEKGITAIPSITQWISTIT